MRLQLCACMKSSVLCVSRDLLQTHLLRSDGSFSLVQSTSIFRRLITAPSFSGSRDIFIYLELACHDEQNGSQTFKIGARIVELWRFKSRKVEKLQEEDHLAIFYGERVFSDAAKNSTIFGRN